MRLWVKLQLAILAVVVVGVVVVSFVANQAAEREVRAFMFGNGMTTAVGLAQELADYYQSQRSWDGVQALLARNGGHGLMGGMGMSQRLTLMDTEGRLIADSAGAPASTTVSVPNTATVVPVLVNGQTVATLLVEGGVPVDDTGNAVDTNALLARVNRAIWLAALLAGAVGLALGGALAYGLTRPLNQLGEQRDDSYVFDPDSRLRIIALAQVFVQVKDRGVLIIRVCLYRPGILRRLRTGLFQYVIERLLNRFRQALHYEF